MGDDSREPRLGDFRGARIGAAAAFTIVFVLLLVVDAVDRTYDPPEAILGILMAGILTLLGIEAGTWLRGGGR